MQHNAFREHLQQLAQSKGYALDAVQLAASEPFARLESELSKRVSRGLRSLFNRPAVLRGIYLCGPVGRGKTFIMDAYHSFSREPRKQRIHFHTFMRQVHTRMRSLQGQENPLRLVARRIAEDTRLLCLDEFHVTDIGDAMILSGLLGGLFAEGVAVVTTSNDVPDQLYAHGLQRARFLPAIEVIKTHLEYVTLLGPIDYRLRHLEKAGVFHTPLDADAARAMDEAFAELTGGAARLPITLDIEDRPIHAHSVGDGVAWFSFQELCETARAAADYIELARRFHTVLIEGVPRMTPNDREPMRRLTWLVDEFYDRRVNLVLSAACALPDLFSALADLPGVARTQSRLIEMQSHDYLSHPHLS